jgi:hypothetical protein
VSASDPEKWRSEVAPAVAALSDFTTADGLEVKDEAGRVVATFASEFAADAIVVLVDGYEVVIDEWKEDATLIGKLQGSDEGHQAETIAAETKHQDEKRRADKLENEADDQRIEIAELKRQIAELKIAVALAQRERL